MLSSENGAEMEIPAQDGTIDCIQAGSATRGMNSGGFGGNGEQHHCSISRRPNLSLLIPKRSQVST